MVTRTGTRVEGTHQVDRINALTRAGVLVGWSRDAFHKLRRGRNEAAHNLFFDTTMALRPCWQLGDLFDRAMSGPRPVAAARYAIVERAQRPAPLNEMRAREKIDAMLVKAGWRIQDKADANPLAGTGVAIREFTLATGRADYVLYVDGKIVGVIEAMSEGTPLAGALAQNERYAAGVLQEHVMAVWRRQAPFAFRYATGTETYFLNCVDPDARSREVFAFHRPRPSPRGCATPTSTRTRPPSGGPAHRHATAGDPRSSHGPDRGDHGPGGLPGG
ncbi:hypothetical protein ACFW7K_09515 [Streptomyces sp. NPDC058735]|uniref:hypothetical protein n=1 Tax=unclassified Streptomyces TaxID=2593676 RepID=UPI0036CAD3DE